MAKLLDAAWRNYSEKRLPVQVCDELRVILRDAFYAGTHSLLTGLAEAIIESGSNDDITVFLTSASKELQEYYDSMQKHFEGKLC